MRSPVYALLSLCLAACSVEGYGETSEEIGAADDALIGGQPALESQYPSTVLGPGCTAAKVGPRHFLTAAHCVDDEYAATVAAGYGPGGSYLVSADNTPPISPYVNLTIQQTYIHPKWLEVCAAALAGGATDCGVNVLNPGYAPDLAVVVVNELSPTIPAAVVDGAPVAVGDPVVATGYGCENPGGGGGGLFKLQDLSAAPASILDHAGSYVSGTAINDVAAAYVLTPGYASSTTYASLCPGDSGGPLYRQSATDLVVVGVNAYYTFPSGWSGPAPSQTNWHTRLDTAARYPVTTWLQGLGVSVINGGAAPTCTDGVKNGTETDVDCGGTCTADCANGQACVTGADCTSLSCVAGVCQPSTGTAPCSSLCTGPTVFSSASFSSGSLGSGARCFETTASLSGANCGNFAGGRTFAVNGTTVTCNGGNITLPAKRNGGYCFQASAGNEAWAYFTSW
ncbi:putative exported peptidase / protease [Sorangium cellulosum So ce56]|uniref:Exported peptidase / protease n=1 Tax=Sorangium cellulosum (strain So ce56) TaxID=448385 RepID=A9ENZ7_SORC5|nr:putative exported peptidase / protease [Sorangium cellulosum So ce56]